jgi:hypothetical protein
MLRRRAKGGSGTGRDSRLKGRKGRYSSSFVSGNLHRFAGLHLRQQAAPDSARGVWSKIAEPANRSTKSALSCLFAIGDGNPVNCLAFIEGIPQASLRSGIAAASTRRYDFFAGSGNRRGRGMRTKIG